MPAVLWQRVAVARTPLPWEAVLEAGRDEQLVPHGPLRRPAGAPRRRFPRTSTPTCARPSPARGSRRCTRTRPRTWESAREGHTIVTTGTASGKSLAFNLPVLDTLARDGWARAIYLYPTKALAQDQARALHALGAPFLRPAIYDGDTPREERKAIRRRANLLLTNPDMLHLGDAAPAPLVRRRAGQPRLGRGRRGARVPRRVRLPRGQRAAAPAPPGQRLRHRAALRAGQRDGRQPPGAGRAADRTRGAARGRGRRPAGRAAGGHVEPAAARREHGRARVRAVGGGRAARRARAGGRCARSAS